MMSKKKKSNNFCTSGSSKVSLKGVYCGMAFFIASVTIVFFSERNDSVSHFLKSQRPLPRVIKIERPRMVSPQAAKEPVTIVVENINGTPHLDSVLHIIEQQIGKSQISDLDIRCYKLVGTRDK